MYKKLIPSLLKKYYKFFLAIGLALALSMGLLFGFRSGCDSTDISLDKFAKDYRYGDAIITTDLLDKQELSKLDNIEGIKNYSSRLQFYLQGKLQNNRYINLRAFTYNNKDSLLHYVYEINESDKYPNVAINNSFLRSNSDVNLLDTIEINYEDINETLCLGKAICTPDCVSIVLNEYIYGNNPDLAYVYIPEEYFINTKYENSFNQIFVFFEDWANTKQVLNNIETVLGKQNIIDKSLYDNSSIRKRIDINLMPVRSLANILPSAFYAIVIVVSFLFLLQIIKQSRKDIGILKTLGQSNTNIIKLFSLTIFITSIFSIILGTLFGYFIMILIAKLYALNFNIPIIQYTINYKIYFLSIVVTILSGQFAVLLSLRQIQNISPIEAISSSIDLMSKQDTRIISAFSIFNSRIKYSLSSIIKNKKRFIFSTICLMACVCLVFTSLAFYDSKNEIRDSLFLHRIKYDYQLFYDRQINNDDLIKLDMLDSITDYEKLSYLKSTISFNNIDTKITIRGIEKDSKLIGLYKLEKLESSNDGIIIEKHIANKLNAKIGDYVTINNKKIQIIGMVDEYVDRYCYMEYEQLEKLGQINQYSIVLNTNNDKQIIELVNDNPEITLLSSTTNIKKGIDTEFKLYNIGVYILIICALFIGFIIVYNTSQTNLLEQMKQLSVLRTIGYQVKDISKMLAIQTFMQTLLSLILGLIFGENFAKFALKNISTSSREYPFTSNPDQYILTCIIVIIFIIFTHIVSMNSIKNWDLVSNTKEKD